MYRPMAAQTMAVTTATPTIRLACPLMRLIGDDLSGVLYARGGRSSVFRRAERSGPKPAQERAARQTDRPSTPATPTGRGHHAERDPPVVAHDEVPDEAEQ